VRFGQLLEAVDQRLVQVEYHCQLIAVLVPLRECELGDGWLVGRGGVGGEQLQEVERAEEVLSDGGIGEQVLLDDFGHVVFARTARRVGVFQRSHRPPRLLQVRHQLLYQHGVLLLVLHQDLPALPLPLRLRPHPQRRVVVRPALAHAVQLSAIEGSL
jgi:hypothetical protein